MANSGYPSVGTTVGEYNAATGAAINPSFITGLNLPGDLALSGNTLFVGNYNGGTVGEYNATTGAAINASFITGLNHPTGLLLSGNTLFVANQFGNTVGEYDATTGAAINASFITTGLDGPTGLLVAPVPEPSPIDVAWADTAISRLSTSIRFVRLRFILSGLLSLFDASFRCLGIGRPQSDNADLIALCMDG